MELSNFYVLHCRFGTGTETKSGRVVKTPGKFSACVTGKRKSHRKQSDPDMSFFSESESLNLTASSMALDVTSSSLMVNTSLQTDAETTA